MKHITGRDFDLEDSCVTFGAFDGLHRGHRSVIGTVVERGSRGLTPVALSLDYDPCGLSGEDTVLYTEEEKAALLKSSGLEVLISYPFTAADMEMEPEDFVKEVLLGACGMKTLVTGKDLRFGRGRKGDLALLDELSDSLGFELIVCDTVKAAGRPVTSSLVREEIDRYNLDYAGDLLGRPFSITGPIVHGKALGRTAKLPTANVGYGKDKLIPPHGIYATVARFDDRAFKGLSIIGLRPTVDNLPDVTVETYLLDFSGDIYGTQVDLEVHARVREIRTFKDLHEVKKQVEKDIESVRDYLEGLE